MDPKRVARRFLAAAAVVKLTPKAKVPVLTIRGRKYLLSNYWQMSEDLSGMAEGGAKLIDTGGNKRFPYLWVYDTDRKVVAMWRVSDGDEKVYDTGSSSTHNIYTLEKKGQLNRVTRQEFSEIERFMKDRAEDHFKSLQEHLKEIATDWDKAVKDILEKHYEARIKPVIDRRLSELKSGVVPFGFKVNDRILEHRSAEDQAKMFVIGQSLKDFTQAEAYRIVSEAVGYDAYEPPHGGDSQAVQWAWSELVGEVYDQF